MEHLTSSLTVLEYDDGWYMTGISTVKSAPTSPVEPDSTDWRRSKSLDRSGQNKDITLIQMLLIFLAGFTHFILHCAMKFHHNGSAQNTFPYKTTI